MSAEAGARAAVKEEQVWRPAHNPWAIALTVTMATFMEVLDTSIANVSLPHIAGNLAVTQDESTWVLTSYLVSNAIVLPVSGWVSTKIGRKRFYMTCVALFTLSSFLCGIAPNLGLLIFFRVLQGIGGGGLGPSEQSILTDTFEPAKRGIAFAVYGMAVVLAPAIGPTLGGFITDHYSWRWIFFINVPVGLLSLFLSNRVVEDPPYLKKLKNLGGKFDGVGMGLIAVGLGTLEVVLDRGQELDWFGSPLIVQLSLVAAVSLVTAVVWELHHPSPIVDLRLFGTRSFAAANLLMVTLGGALFATTLLLPQYTQVVMGYTAQQAGMALTPGGITVILLLPMVGILVSKSDARYLIAFGFSLLSASLFYMSLHLYPEVSFGELVKLRVFQAAGLAFLFVPINTLAYTGIPPQKRGAASGLINFSRNMGGDIGICLVTTLLARSAQRHQSTLASHLDSGNPLLIDRLARLTASFSQRGSAFTAGREATAVIYRSLLRQAVTLAYLDVLVLLAIGTAAVVPLVFLLKRATPGGGGAAMAH